MCTTELVWHAPQHLFSFIYMSCVNLIFLLHNNDARCYRNRSLECLKFAKYMYKSIIYINVFLHLLSWRNCHVTFPDQYRWNGCSIAAIVSRSMSHSDMSETIPVANSHSCQPQAKYFWKRHSCLTSGSKYGYHDTSSTLL